MSKRSVWRAALVVAAMAGAPASGQNGLDPVPPPISAEEFGALPFFSDPEISPDGASIIGEATVGGRTSLVLIDAATRQPVRRFPVPENAILMWSRWAGTKVIVSVAAQSRAYGFYFTRLMLLDPATGVFRPLAQEVRSEDGDDLIHVDPAGRFLLLSAAKRVFQYPAVWRIDLQTTQAVQVQKPRDHVWGWFADSNGVVRAGLGLQNKRYWLLYREDGTSNFRRILKGKLDSDEDQDNIERYVPLVGSDVGYAVADKGSGRFGLYRYDFASDRLGEPVFEHPEVDVDDFVYTPDGRDVAAVTYTDDRERIHWFDANSRKRQEQIDRALPDAMNHIVSTSRSGDRMIVASTAAHDPGMYFLFNTKTRELNPLIRPYGALEGKVLAPVRHVRYRARDGLSVPAYLTLPVGRPAKGLPLIVMPHGGPFARDKWEYDPWVQFLANRGYAVLQPNFRGSTGYGKAYVEAGHSQWGRKMQDDIDDGVAWLVSQGQVDGRRVCIMGASYGGYAAMWAAARNPGLYRCAISFAGISDVEAMLAYDRRLFVARRYYRDWRDQVRGPGELDLDSVSPIAAAPAISVPLLLAHGKLDDNVPATQSEKLAEALRKAGKPHELVIYPDEGHSFGKVENSVDFLKRVEAFLRKHNPAAR